MIKSNYNRNVDVEEQLGEDLVNPPGLNADNKYPTDDNKNAFFGFETEWAISAARLQEKYELDARFAEIIAMIDETRHQIE